VDPAALAEVRDLLGDLPRGRDMLLEHLHLLQDRHGGLHARHLVALAEEMRLAPVEVYEVASFYAHFDFVEDGAEAPPPAVRVCDGLSCEMAGARDLLDALPARLGPGRRVVSAPCMGACHRAPAVSLGHATGGHATGGHAVVERATVEGVARIVEGGETPAPETAPIGFAAYREGGGYRLLEDCLLGRRTPEDVIAALEEASLRGLGGAGYPTGTKWKLVRQEPGPRLMAINADEGEPGTFKDRHHLETDPHRFLEGALVGAWVVEATDVYVYLRDEYPRCRALLLDAFEEVRRAGLARHARLHLRRGAGAYICGEESAMLESIEGKRPLPRNKPPYPSQVGLFGRPTLVNNVETVFWVRDVVERGGAWWAGFGRNGRRGLRSFSVSGRVREPGMKLAPAGITARELIEEFCGGMAEGHAFKAYLPGGASGGILPASMADLPLDFGTLEPHGCFIGSAAVVVLSDKDDMRAVARNLMRFFEDESCGQCTPCRVGTEKAARLLARPAWDRPLLEELGRLMADASICGLGQAAMNPVRQILRHFPEEVA
jgi:formate dehydrogenase